MMKNQLFFEFSQPVTRSQLDAALTLTVVRTGEAEDISLCVFDSADWRIWKAGQVLVRKGHRDFQLLGAQDVCLATAVANRKQRFARDFSGTMAEQLGTLVAVRALVAQFSCHLNIQHLILLNNDEKTVARLQLLQLTPPGHIPLYLVKAAALRGYEQTLDQIKKDLEPLSPRPCPSLSMRSLLLRAGLSPDPAPDKPAFHLAAKQPTERAVTTICLALVNMARQQEPGIINDLDTEFIHQYRVNLRKARSLISLFKKSFAAERYQLLRRELKAMAQQTNRLRDLDVFLLDRQDYSAMLPENLRPGLDALFQRISRRRHRVLKKVVATLTGERYQQTAAHLVQSLQEPPALQTRPATDPIIKQVSRKILSHYRAIKQKGGLINAATPDEQIHALRIEMKKLRYLLELFAELFVHKKIRALIKSLKLLQDNLGRFNDYSSQREFLELLIQDQGTTAAQRDAVQGLSAVLFNKQQQERSKLVDLIAAFSDRPVDLQFQALFHQPPPMDSKQ